MKKRSLKSKVYELIGRAVTAIMIYAVIESGVIAGGIYVLNHCITTI